ncbi:MAG: putative beta-lysine N-acetyltransferase [Pricia sp.]|nr:putative beta-lysine N-acetyltransferase [Pricia sp.]
MDSLITKINELAHQKKYDKIVGRVPQEAIEVFQSSGYRIEATIPKLYNGKTTGYFLADYLNGERRQCTEGKLKTIASVKTIARAASAPLKNSNFTLGNGLHVRKLNKEDMFALADLHAKAFKTYPLPIHKPEYLIELSDKNHEFYGLFKYGELLVSTIVKILDTESNLEIVDFATHPDCRGQNLSYYLVQQVKKNRVQMGCKAIYSLVRASSYGLNITFSKQGFTLGGTLYNDTMIRDNLESMNVWYCH